VQGQGWLGALASVAAVVAVAANAPADPAVAGGPGLALRQLGSFNQPVYVDQPPGHRGLVFVVEQRGVVRIVRAGLKVPRPFLDIRHRVLLTAEEGMFSIAFDPRYKRNRRFYVAYTNRGGDLQVDAFETKQGAPTRAKRASKRRVITIDHPLIYHYGGQLAFGPDGYLYVSTGDGGGSGDPYDNAQDPNSLLGKLLRIDPLKHGYKAATTNPFVDERGRNEIYSLGFREPWRFAFDRRTGDLVIGDVGQRDWEEIDHTTIAGARGANFGWDCREGFAPYTGPPAAPSAACVGASGFTDPIHVYSHAEMGCGRSAVIGGYVVRDRSLPAFGRYLYADLCGGDIRSLNPYASNPTASDISEDVHVELPTSFGEGHRGRLFVASFLGPVYRIVRG
jgi:glucose/arabinose dehydrogenase